MNFLRFALPVLNWVFPLSYTGLSIRLNPISLPTSFWELRFGRRMLYSALNLSTKNIIQPDVSPCTPAREFLRCRRGCFASGYIQFGQLRDIARKEGGLGCELEPICRHHATAMPCHPFTPISLPHTQRAKIGYRFGMLESLQPKLFFLKLRQDLKTDPGEEKSN